MKLGKFKIFIFIFFIFNSLPIFAEDKIESVPLINLEELSPTFEEGKDELENVEESNNNVKPTQGPFSNNWLIQSSTTILPTLRLQ